MRCWLDKYLESEEKNKTTSIYKIQIHNLHKGMNTSGSAIAEHLINNHQCTSFSVVSQLHSDIHMKVLEILYIKSLQPSLRKQKKWLFFFQSQCDLLMFICIYWYITICVSIIFIKYFFLYFVHTCFKSSVKLWKVIRMKTSHLSFL